MSNTRNAIVTSFLGLLPVKDGTANGLFEIIKSEISISGVLLENCTGYGSDGAAAMVGRNNSVWTRLKAAAPDCTI